MPLTLSMLTGRELDKAREAADYLLTLSDEKKVGELDRSLYVKLDTLRADLTGEQTERRKIAASNVPISRE